MRAISAPTDLSGCAMWFDAGQGITQSGGLVSQWSDLSGNARHLTQSSDPLKPTYNAGNARFGGKPTVDWLAAGVGTRLNAPAATIAQPLTIFVCARASNASATQICLYDNQSGAELTFDRTASGNVNIFAGASLQAPSPLGTEPFVVAAVYGAGGPSARLRIRGETLISNRDVGNNNITAFRLGTFIDGFTSTNWNGEIAEVIVFNRRLSDGEIALVERYLARKYRLPTGRAIVAPTDLRDCALWLDAAQGVTLDGSSKVSQWNDLSGNNNHATQSTPGSRPGVVTVNGQTAIAFDGTDDQLIASNITPTDSTCFLVARQTVALGGYRLVLNVRQTAIYSTLNSGPWGVFTNVECSAAETFGTSMRVFSILRRNEAAGNIRLRSAHATRAVHSTNALRNGTQTEIGGSAAGSQFSQADIHAVIVYSRALSDGEVWLVERYLKRRFAL